MTGYPNENFEAFHSAAHRLRMLGYEVVNPAEGGEQASWESYLCDDICKMTECDGIATLSGWQRSAGALLEVETGVKLGKVIAPLDFWIGVFTVSATMHERAKS